MKVAMLIALLCLTTGMFAMTGFDVSTVNSTLDNVVPVVTLSAPTSGQTWYSGETHAITWTAADTNFGANPIRLEYTLNGGSSYTEIVANTANDGRFDWLIPAVNSTTVRVRIKATDSFGLVAQRSSTNFTLAVNRDVEVSSGNVTGAAIFANGIPTGEFTPHTFILTEGTTITYTVEKTDYTWTLATGSDSNIITNLAGSKNIVFEGTFTRIDPVNAGFVYTGNPDVPITVIAGTIETLEVPPPTITPSGAIVMVFTGNSTSDLTVTVPVGTWYVIAYYNDPADGGLTWHHGNPYPAEGIRNVLFANVPFGAKGDIPVIIDHVDDTLPVELSSFTAITTAGCFVNLQWTTQSETNLSGYYVYRNFESSLSSAVCINALIPATNSSQTMDYSYTDNETEAGNTYYYWLQVVNLDGTLSYHGPLSINVTNNATPEITEITSLGSAFPNPFRTGCSTSIGVSVKAGETGTVSIFNLRGQTVKTFPLQTGNQILVWDAKGSSSGVYLYKLSTPSCNVTRKLVLLK